MDGPYGVRRIISSLGYVFSEGHMAFWAIFAGDRALELHLTELVESEHLVAVGRSWDGLIRLVRERPVTGAILALGAVSTRPSIEGALAQFRSQFPGLGLIVLVRRHRDPLTLFQVGRAGIRDLILLSLEGRKADVGRAMARASERSATSIVLRSLSPYLPSRELRVVHLAMDSVHRRWSAEELAGEMGLTRPFLSERLKACGLPSLGHLLLWTRLFHAGRWLEEPGRTGESVGRQLEYSSGAAFRRALKHYTGLTPTDVRENGGLRLILRHFFSRTDLRARSTKLRVETQLPTLTDRIRREWE